jgi:hypothetical protein
VISKKFRTAALALLVSAFHLAAGAQVSRDVAEDLMHKSGLWEQLGSIDQQLEFALASDAKKDGKGLSPAERDRLGRAFKSAYAPAHLRLTAMTAFAKEINPGQVESITAWYDSPEGVLITKVEESGSASQRRPGDVMKEGAEIFSHASADRQSLLKRLMEVTHATETTAAIVINTAIGVQQGLAAAQPSRAGPSIADVRAALEKQRPQLMQALANVALTSFSVMYSSVSDESLEKYIAFLASPAGADFTMLGLRALEAAFVEAARDLGREISAAKDNANL